MTIPNPEHLFEQAERLSTRPTAGAPRQVDIRRAISTAYYGVFHGVSGAGADFFIGARKRSTGQYTLVYRGFDHKWLKELCDDIRKPTIPSRYSPYLPVDGFDAGVMSFAAAIVELQQKRHTADYDPSVRMRTSDATSAIATARAALRRFAEAPAPSREAFLALLLFPPRR